MEGMRKQIIEVLCFSGLGVVMITIMSFYPPESWIAPESAKNNLNPFKNNVSTTSDGKKLYTNLCVVCHGNKGKGDGIAGMTLKPRSSNLTLPIVQKSDSINVFVG